MIIWTDYIRYRADLRGFDLDEVEKILRFGEDRYMDTVTGRAVVVGKHKGARPQNSWVTTGLN